MDYENEMKALNALMDKEDQKAMTGIQDYGNSLQRGYDYGKPRIAGPASVMLNYHPQDTSKEAMQAFSGADEMAVKNSFERRKNMMDRYRATQEDRLKTLGLGLQARQANTAENRLSEMERHNLATENITARKELEKPKPTSKSIDALDRQFAKTYNDYQNEGGYTTSQVNLEKMKDVVNQLRSGAVKTGGLGSQLPTSGKIGALINPGTTRLQEQLESAIQNTLRPILGAQMAAIEGQRVFERAFNPAMPNDVNIKKIEYEIKALERMAKATRDAVDYYENNNQSLAGYKSQSTENTSVPVTATGNKSREEMIAAIKAKMGQR